MLKKISLLFAVVLCFGSVAVFAQNAPVTGKVELKKADGTVVPVEGATVEAFRTDIKSAGPADKTDKKGQFSFAGLQLGATFVLSVSASGASPTYLPNIRPGNGSENLTITLSEGDGRKLTADEVRAALAKAPTPGASGTLTKEQREALLKEQADYEKKKAEVESKNTKIQQENAVIEASLKAGNEAFGAKNWDVAVAKYNEGIAASPDFAGSAPVLLNNKGAALRERAVVKYNTNVKSTDATVKIEAFKAVKADFAEAADAYNRSWTILKAAQPGDISDPKIKDAQLAAAATGAKDTFRLMALTEQVDDTKLDIAKALIPEYIAIETDAAKKEAAKLILADVYRVAGNADGAIAEYRKVLETTPDNLDAMAGLGLSLVNAGYINDNKAQLQEGANVLQKFASAAPDTHKYKDDAVGLIETLKTEQKIAPQKAGSTKKKT